MIKIEPEIHGIPFKLRIKKYRNDAGKLTLGVTLRPKYKTALLRNGNTQKTMSFHYFTNGVISKFQWTDQKGISYIPKAMTLREAKVQVIKYLINEFKIQ